MRDIALLILIDGWKESAGRCYPQTTMEPLSVRQVDREHPFSKQILQLEFVSGVTSVDDLAGVFVQHEEDEHDTLIWISDKGFLVSYKRGARFSQVEHHPHLFYQVGFYDTNSDVRFNVGATDEAAAQACLETIASLEDGHFKSFVCRPKLLGVKCPYGVESLRKLLRYEYRNVTLINMNFDVHQAGALVIPKARVRLDQCQFEAGGASFVDELVFMKHTNNVPPSFTFSRSVPLNLEQWARLLVVLEQPGKHVVDRLQLDSFDPSTDGVCLSPTEMAALAVVNVERLHISNCRLRAQSTLAFVLALKPGSGPKGLALVLNDMFSLMPPLVRGRSWHKLCSYIAKSSLQYLRLFVFDPCKSSEIPPLLSSVRLNTNLKTLRLENVLPSDDSFVSFTKCLAHHPSLVEVSLTVSRDNFSQAVGKAAIIDMLNANQVIEKVFVGHDMSEDVQFQMKLISRLECNRYHKLLRKMKQLYRGDVPRSILRQLLSKFQLKPALLWRLLSDHADEVLCKEG